MLKNCAYCGQPFEAKGRGRFCSDSHRVMGHRQQKGLPPTPFKTDLPTADTVKQLEQEIQRLKADQERSRKDLWVASSIIQGYQLGHHKDPKLTESANSFLALYPLNTPNSKPETVAKPAPKKTPAKTETPTDIASWLEALRKK